MGRRKIKYTLIIFTYVANWKTIAYLKATVDNRALNKQDQTYNVVCTFFSEAT